MEHRGRWRWRQKRGLLVCTANICRSPMAEAIFNALVSDADLPYEASSAGAALVGEPIAPHARSMLEEANLVLAMIPEHVAALHRLAGGPSEKIRTLPGHAKGAPDAEGIADPYGMLVSAYRASSRETSGTWTAWCARCKGSDAVRRLFCRRCRLPGGPATGREEIYPAAGPS